MIKPDVINFSGILDPEGQKINHVNIAKGSKEDAYLLVLRCTGLRTQDYTGQRTELL